MFSSTAVQGEAINRAGQINVNVEINNDHLVKVKIAGNAVIVFKSELFMN
jgi:predicted PhzF superfamily epimerase YddE/YHI9